MIIREGGHQNTCSLSIQKFNQILSILKSKEDLGTGMIP